MTLVALDIILGKKLTNILTWEKALISKILTIIKLLHIGRY